MTSEILEPGPSLDEPLLILIPVFNDWPSLGKLLDALDKTLAEHDLEAGVLVVDDGSTTAPRSTRRRGAIVRFRMSRSLS